MSPVEAFITLGALTLITLAIGPKGARRCALVLATNWACCQTFVEVTGNATPWSWFWAMDIMSAIAVTARPVSRWQAILAYLYIGQLGIHSWFAITGGDPHRYLSWLDWLFIVQMALVATWTGGHGLNRIWRGNRRAPVRLHYFGRETHR